MWKTYNHYEAEARAAGKDLLKVNLDETSVCVVQKPLQGVVMKTGRRLLTGVPSRLRVGRSLQRTNLTYVALISDDAEFSAQLPQFIIGNRRSFPATRYGTYFQEAPRNVWLLVADTAWNTHVIMKKIIRVLALVGRVVRPNAQIVLCLDTHQSHIHEEVFATYHEEGIRPLLIPARTTSLLQPLDVWVFRVFKERLRRRFHDLHADAQGPADVPSLLAALYDAIDATILQRAWPHIFAECGLSHQQQHVSDFLQKHIPYPAHLVCWLMDNPDALTDADIRAVMPSNRRISLATFLPPPPPEPMLALADAPLDAAEEVHSF